MENRHLKINNVKTPFGNFFFLFLFLFNLDRETFLV